MNGIKKYLHITRTFWQDVLVFRFDFWVARIRNLVVIFTIYYLYSSIYKSNYSFPNFSEKEIMTYVILSPFIFSMVFVYSDYEIAGKISDGSLNFYLVKPINYLAYEFFKTLSKRVANLITGIVEILIFYFIFKPNFEIYLNKIPLTIFFIFLCSILFFVINSYSAICAFVMPYANGPIFILRQVLEYFTGRLFPLTILPLLVQNILKFTPLWYIMYFPIDYYFSSWTSFEILTRICIFVFWIIFLYILLQLFWKRNIKLYEGYGI